MTQQLVADALAEKALNETGIADFDNESWREGLGVFLSDFNKGIARGLYTDAGIQAAASDSVRWLKNRLLVTDYLRRRPELLERPIERPVIVMGIPRTGTTLLSNLLACDPVRRSPLAWEIDEPVPPATSATLKTDPRALARIEQNRRMLAENPGAGKIYRFSPIYPNECVWYLAHDFKTLMIESKGILPEYRDFIFSCDMTSAYAYHRKFLQLLQADAPGIWNLKMPSHSLHLDYLIKEYPDARLIWTHRDPFTATGSLCSIISFSHMMVLGRIDTEWLAEDYPWQAAEHANRIMEFRDKYGEDRVIDIHYADLTNDPMGTMRKLYAALGDAFTPEAEAGMREWLADNPQDKFGKHEYKLGQYGLSKEQLEPMFERYLSRYDVVREG